LITTVTEKENGQTLVEARKQDTGSQKDGVIHLQEKLLSKILGNSGSVMIDDVDQRITLIKQKLHSLRVLLVLDDVNRLVKLEKLLEKMIGLVNLGSKIIITTKDKHLLRAHGVDLTYQANELDHNEAFQLFRWNALRSTNLSRILWNAQNVQ
jgi:hypothetical protein